MVMIAHHNTALCCSDHISLVQGKNFPDSKIAKNYHCARKNTVCILNYALAPHLRDELNCHCNEGRAPYSLSVDASSNIGLSKMNPLTVRIYYVNGQVVSQ